MGAEANPAFLEDDQVIAVHSPKSGFHALDALTCPRPCQLLR